MRTLASDVLVTFSWVVFVYFLLINLSYVVLISLASIDIVKHRRRIPISGLDDLYANPLMPAVSVLLPSYNEERTIVASVLSMLSLRYPSIEVVVIDDGSTDETFARLAEAFDLVPIDRVIPDDVPIRHPVESVHVGRHATNLVVVRKVNGGKESALNVGINVSSGELLCMVDADSLLDPDALLNVVEPFVHDPEHVVATGGVVRVVNGGIVEGGRLIDLRMPRSWLARIQVVEYLRAFLLGRGGWSKLNTLMIVSGAFGLFRRDVVVKAGGLSPATLGEDAELVVRLHKIMRRERRKYRIVFVAEPVSWTEAPQTLTVMARQRRRWARGLSEVLWRHRTMLFNPRYGRIGLIGMPYFLIFELLGPFIEVIGIAAVIVGLLVGAIDVGFAILFLVVSVAFGTALSLAVLMIEELSFHRYHRRRDLAVAVVATVVENLGYRQMTAVWRIQGTVAAMRGQRREWGEMRRRGFDEATLASSNQQSASLPESSP